MESGNYNENLIDGFFFTSYLKENSKGRKLMKGALGFKKMYKLWNPLHAFFMTYESVSHPLAPVIVFF